VAGALGGPALSGGGSLLPPVRFFLPLEPAELARLARVDPDRQWRELVTGERAWILQTYLRLRAAGRPVELIGHLPAGAEPGLLLFHAKHERALRRLPGAGRQILVGVRADNRQPLAAEFEVLQNGCFADGRRRFFVPHWPQPGLVPRDPARGDRVRTVAFKGFRANLHPDFLAPEWAAWLAGRGVEWRLDAIDFAGEATDVGAARWADFAEVDLLLAVRLPERKTARSKPATKLVNAWLAGVPALLGPERAFRELRRDPLDYLEVAEVAAAREAIARLAADPAEYRARIEHGRRRARDFDAAAVLRAWEELLFARLPELAASAAGRRSRRLPLGWRRAARWLARTAALRPPR